MAQRIHGFGTFTLTGFTGPILTDFSYKAQRGNIKPLLGNPATGAYADTRVTTANSEDMTVKMAFEVRPDMAAMKALIGTALTLSVTSDNTSAATQSVTSGIVQNIVLDGKKDDWWICSVTTRLV